EGSHNIGAAYSGDSDHSASSGSSSLGIAVRSATTSVGCTPATMPVNAATTCAATVTDSDTGTAITATGTVSWSSSGSGAFSAASCTLNGSAMCSVTYTPAPGSEGNHNISGSYGGDTDHSGSLGGATVTATKRATSTTVDCNPLSVVINGPTSCTATVADTDTGTAIAPTGAVSFSSSAAGSFSPSSCTLNGSGQCSVSYTPSAGSVGSHTVNAAYGGDADHSPSSGTTTVTATKR